ncbi:MAG: chitosanase [Acidobacteria bacterium]|nr:chitosanase [Acidobacteriota bacterium]
MSNEFVRLAKDIIGRLESGNQYGKIQAKDTGLLSYGRYQVTLSSGHLHKVLESYVNQSKGEIASKLQKYLSLTRAKDKRLASNDSFKKLLVQAAGDPDMQRAQENWFDNNPWKNAKKSADVLGIKSPAGYALLADSDVHGGLTYDVGNTKKRLGKIGNLDAGGSRITEKKLLSTYLEERKGRLLRNSDKNSVAAAGKLAEAKVLEAQAGSLSPQVSQKISSLKEESKRLKVNSRMLHTSATTRRMPMWQRLISLGDINFRGDKNGKVELSIGKQTFKVKGLLPGAAVDSLPAASGLSKPKRTTSEFSKGKKSAKLPAKPLKQKGSPQPAKKAGSAPKPSLTNVGRKASNLQIKIGTLAVRKQAKPVISIKPPKNQSKSYLVKRGQTLSGIAKNFGYKNSKQFLTDFKKLNPGSNPNRIIAGKRYSMPFKRF